METKPKAHFVVAVVAVGRYEFAPMTQLQAVALTAIRLCEAKTYSSIETSNLAKLREALLQASRLLDFLGEASLCQRVSAIHANFISGDLTIPAVNVACEQFSDEFLECLREATGTYKATT